MMPKAIKKFYGAFPTAALMVSAGGPGGPGFLYQATPALNADDFNPGSSFRIVLPVTGASLSQIRATIIPGSTETLSITHASIGKWDSSAPAYANTTSTPIELKFGGASGFSNKTAPQTSDWANLTGLALTTGDKIVVIYDTLEGAWTVASQRFNNESTGVTSFFKAIFESWDTADVSGSGFASIASTNYSIGAVETQ